MKLRHNLDENAPEYQYKVGEWVKLKNYGKNKFEFNWKGSYAIVDAGYTGTYWLMNPSGRRLPSTINQRDLAPWLSSSMNNGFFYDAT